MKKLHPGRGALAAAMAFAAAAGALAPGTSAQKGADASVAQAAGPSQGQQETKKADTKGQGNRTTGGSRLDAFMGGRRARVAIPRRFPGLGWPVAVDRRMAKKRRDKARNKAMHRGPR